MKKSYFVYGKNNQYGKIRVPIYAESEHRAIQKIEELRNKKGWAWFFNTFEIINIVEQNNVDGIEASNIYFDEFDEIQPFIDWKK